MVQLYLVKSNLNRLLDCRGGFSRQSLIQQTISQQNPPLLYNDDATRHEVKFARQIPPGQFPNSPI